MWAAWALGEPMPKEMNYASFAACFLAFACFADLQVMLRGILRIQDGLRLSV